jgi:hypothetical protein
VDESGLELRLSSILYTNSLCTHSFECKLVEGYIVIRKKFILDKKSQKQYIYVE